MSETLYNLTAQMMEIEAALEESGGELTPEAEALMAETGESLMAKVDNYNALILRLGDYSENLAREIKRLQGLKKTADNSARRVKGHVMDTMLAFGIDRLEGRYCKMSLRSTQAVEVDEDTLLAPYRARVERLMLPSWVTCELKVSKTALKEAFKGKEVTPMGVSFTSGKSLIIK